MSRTLPILFNCNMVQAILEDRKTVTRRLIKPSYRSDESGFQVFTNMGTKKKWAEKIDPEERSFDPSRYVLPPYQPGDILYVRETWNRGKNGYRYKADWEKEGIADITKWKPSIHMPRTAARIWLKVTDVRIEHLQEISGLEAYKEGAVAEVPPICKDITYPKNFENWTEYRREEWFMATARAKYIAQIELENRLINAFSKIWDSTISKGQQDLYGWGADPWVWRIEFERCEKPETER